MSFLQFIPGILDSVGSIMEYNKRAREGHGLTTRGYNLRKRMGYGYGMRKKHVVHDRKIVNKARRYRGGRIAKKRYHRRGRGFASDFISNIPLIGPLLAPIGRAIGLGMKRQHMSMAQRKKVIRMLHSMKGKGLSPMHIASMRQRIGGRLLMKKGGLLAPAGGMIRKHMRKGHYRYVHKSGSGVKRVHVRKHRVGGYIPYTF